VRRWLLGECGFAQIPRQGFEAAVESRVLDIGKRFGCDQFYVTAEGHVSCWTHMPAECAGSGRKL